MCSHEDSSEPWGAHMVQTPCPVDTRKQSRCFSIVILGKGGFCSLKSPILYFRGQGAQKASSHLRKWHQNMKCSKRHPLPFAGDSSAHILHLDSLEPRRGHCFPSGVIISCLKSNSDGNALKLSVALILPDIPIHFPHPASLLPS